MTRLLNDFVSPGPEYRGKPFWSWNGDLDQDELLRQARLLKDMGMGGFFMHSRTGLATEYLGDDWFELTNAVADEAKRLGMEAWLYDEDRWPSGTAGGSVTQHPANQAKFLSLRPVAAAEFEWANVGDAVAVFVCRLDGVRATDVERLVVGQAVRAEAADTVLVFTVERHEPSTFYNGFTYLDTLRRDATEAFLASTHDQYAARCGDRLGTSIRGIFTDEPHRGPVMCGFSISNANRLWMSPWTETLFDDYRGAFGDDLVERLPELFLQVDGRVVSPTKWRYMELLQHLFLKNFAEPMLERCERHNMILTGHVLHEDSLTAQTCMQGSLMRYYEYMHWPGIDILGEQTRCWWAAKQLQSVARQLGQKWLLSELYGCTGWQLTFEQHKAVGDWQALFGINVRCHHLSWYTMAGEAKRDYPASISFQSAWWPYYKHVEDYFARFGVLNTHGRAVCDVLVITPVESLWCQIHAGWANSLSPTTDAVKSLEAGYADLFHWLAGAQIDFDYGDEEMLGRLATVADASGRPAVRFGEATYRTIVVGRMTTMRQSTLDLLTAFADAGGKVVFVGDPPTHVDAAVSDAPLHLATRPRQSARAPSVTQTPWHRESVVNAIGLPGRLRVARPDGRPATSVFAQLRVDDAATYCVLLLNTDRQNAEPGLTVTLHVDGDRAAAGLAEWDMETGRRYAVATVPRGDGDIVWTVDLPAGGSRAFMAGVGAADDLTRRPVASAGRRQTIDGPFRYALTEPNVCVLDTASYRIDDGTEQPATEVLKIDRAVRAAFGVRPRAGDMIQPWHRRKTQPTPPTLGRVRLTFTFDVRDVPATPVTLALETPARFAVALNGRTVDTHADAGWWVDPAFRRVPLPADALRPGANELTLDAMFDDDLNLEAVYLLGDFGVTVDGRRATLVALPDTLLPGDLTKQGLPFYGAGVHYRVPVPGDGTLDLTGMEAACAVVPAPDGPRVVAWQPLTVDVSGAVDDGHVTLDVVLTRRNTFGPLHQVPLLTGFYGPDNFVTDGERWSDTYQLLPCGLLRPPVWVNALADQEVAGDA